MPKHWKDLLIAIAIVLLGALVALIFRPPKYDAIVKANDPKLYVPLFVLMGAILVAIIYRSSREP